MVDRRPTHCDEIGLLFCGERRPVELSYDTGFVLGSNVHHSSHSNEYRFATGFLVQVDERRTKYAAIGQRIHLSVALDDTVDGWHCLENARKTQNGKVTKKGKDIT